MLKIKLYYLIFLCLFFLNSCKSLNEMQIIDSVSLEQKKISDIDTEKIIELFAQKKNYDDPKKKCPFIKDYEIKIKYRKTTTIYQISSYCTLFKNINTGQYGDYDNNIELKRFINDQILNLKKSKISTNLLTESDIRGIIYNLDYSTLYQVNNQFENDSMNSIFGFKIINSLMLNNNQKITLKEFITDTNFVRSINVENGIAFDNINPCFVFVDSYKNGIIINAKFNQITFHVKNNKNYYDKFNIEVIKNEYNKFSTILSSLKK